MIFDRLSPTKILFNNKGYLYGCATAGDIFCVSCADRILIYKLPDGKLLSSIAADYVSNYGVSMIATTMNADIIAACWEDGYARIYDTADGSLLHQLNHRGKYDEGILVIDERRQLVTKSERCLKIWSLDSGECLHSFDFKYVHQAAAVDHGRRMLVSLGIDRTYDNRIISYDTASWEIIDCFEFEFDNGNIIDVIPGLLDGGADIPLKIQTEDFKFTMVMWKMSQGAVLDENIEIRLRSPNPRLECGGKVLLDFPKTAEKQESIRIYETATGKLINEVFYPSQSLSTIGTKSACYNERHNCLIFANCSTLYCVHFGQK